MPQHCHPRASCSITRRPQIRLIGRLLELLWHPVINDCGNDERDMVVRGSQELFGSEPFRSWSRPFGNFDAVPRCSWSRHLRQGVSSSHWIRGARPPTCDSKTGLTIARARIRIPATTYGLIRGRRKPMLKTRSHGSPARTNHRKLVWEPQGGAARQLAATRARLRVHANQRSANARKPVRNRPEGASS